MAAKKILMLVGDYVEDYEVMVPFQALLAVGHTVHAVCPDKKAGDSVATAIHDFEGQQTYSEKRGHNFALNASFAEIKAENYDALVIPGGHAPDKMRMRHAMVDLARDAMDANKPVAAICHAASLLISSNSLRGRTLTCWPSIAIDVKNAGGRYVDKPVVEDGNLITSRKPDDVPVFTDAIIRALSKVHD